MARRKKDEIVLLKADIRKLLGQGKKDEEIADELGIEHRHYIMHKKAIMKEEKLSAQKPAIETFIEYQFKQIKNIEQLEEVRERAEQDGKHQNEITALRAKSDILDRIIARGQELGVYHKQGNKISVTGIMSIIHMDPLELAAQLDTSMAKLQALSNDLGRPFTLDSKPALRLTTTSKLPSKEEPKLNLNLEDIPLGTDDVMQQAEELNPEIEVEVYGKYDEYRKTKKDDKEHVRKHDSITNVRKREKQVKELSGEKPQKKKLNKKKPKKKSNSNILDKFKEKVSRDIVCIECGKKFDKQQSAAMHYVVEHDYSLNDAMKKSSG